MVKIGERLGQLVKKNVSWRTVAGSFYYIFVILLVLFICGEQYAAYLGYIPYPEKRHGIDFASRQMQLCGWVSEPGSHISKEDPSVRENVWCDGSRISRPHFARKTRYRALVVGCSQTFGMGVSDQDTFVWRLNEMFPNITFDNYGVCGYGTYQCLVAMQERLKERPYDLVIYGYIQDHGRRNSPYQLNGDLHKNNYFCVGPWCELKNGELSCHSAISTFWFLENCSSLIDFAHRVYAGMQLQHYRSDPELRRSIEEQYEPLTVALVQEMNGLAASNNADFAVMNMDPNALILFDDEANFTRVDVSFAEFDYKHYRVMGRPNFHPNGLTHRIWADKMAFWLRSKGY